MTAARSVLALSAGMAGLLCLHSGAQSGVAPASSARTGVPTADPRAPAPILSNVEQAAAVEGLRGEIAAVWRGKERRCARLRVDYSFATERNGEVAHSVLWMSRDGGLLLDCGHARATTPWQGDYSRTRTHWRDGVMTVAWPVKRLIEVSRTEAPSEVERIAVQTWFRASGLWSWADSLPSLKAPRFLERSTSVVEVLTRAEYVLDHEHPTRPAGTRVTLRTDDDVLHFGGGPDFPLLGRQWRREGKVVMEMAVDEWFDSDIGRVPARFRIEHPNPAGAGVRWTGGGIAVSVTGFDLDVAAEDIAPPTAGAGWIEFDRKAGTSRQTVPGGIDFIHGIGDHLAETFAGRGSTRGGISLLLAAAAAAVAVLWGIRRTPKRRGRNGGSDRLLAPAGRLPSEHGDDARGEQPR